MVVLCAGILLWMGVHLMPSVLPSNKKALVAKLGVNRYKLMFTILAFTAIFLIVIGWKNTEPAYLYHFTWARHVTSLLMIVAVAFMAASNIKSHIGSIVRHPQLTGVFIWAGAHLLANGDTRSVLLFSSIAIWAVLEMLFINRRDGAIEKKQVNGFKGDVTVIVATVVVVAVLLFVHPYLSGVPLIASA